MAAIFLAMIGAKQRHYNVVYYKASQLVDLRPPNRVTQLENCQGVLATDHNVNLE